MCTPSASARPARVRSDTNPAIAIERPIPPSSPAPVTPARSGKVFIIAVVLGLVAFVAFLLLVSPRLLAWTLASAPAPAPHEVAAGTLGSDAWTLTAVESDEPEVPCFTLELGAEVVERCGPTQGRGSAIHDVELHVRGDEALLVVMSASVIGDVRVTTTQGTATHEPTFVDFGFPTGFLALEVPAGAVEVRARDRDGAVLETAACPGEADTDQDDVSCAVGGQTGGQG